MKPRIAITLGDPAGIGPEVAAHAVRNSRVRRVCEAILVGPPEAFALHGEKVPKCKILTSSLEGPVLRLGRPSQQAGRSAIRSLTLALGLLKRGEADALVTAPVSKESFHAADLGFPGHTEWLAEQASVQNAAMLMVAGPMRALLMTRHIPLSQVPKILTPSIVRESAKSLHHFLRRVVGLARPRMVALGINPHASDHGLIGKDEARIYGVALPALKRSGINVQGPIAADAALRDMARGLHDAALAAYHDQGMIALKIFAPEKIVNVTLGLPYVRTSPGHGTAYDIVGRHRADPRPMIEAVLLAAQLARRA